MTPALLLSQGYLGATIPPPLPLAALWSIAALVAAALWVVYAFWRPGSKRVTTSQAPLQNPSAVQLDTIARIHRQREEVETLSRELAQRIDPRIAELRELIERGEALADRLERGVLDSAGEAGSG